MKGNHETPPFDTAPPFVAIVPDAEPGGYFDRTHAVYFVNPLNVGLTNVRESIGGYFCDEDGVMEAAQKNKGPFNLAPRARLLLEMTSLDEFDELVCWWRVAYELEGQRHLLTFGAGKGLRDTQWTDDCPVLNYGALIVSR